MISTHNWQLLQYNYNPDPSLVIHNWIFVLHINLQAEVILYVHGLDPVSCNQ